MSLSLDMALRENARKLLGTVLPQKPALVVKIEEQVIRWAPQAGNQRAWYTNRLRLMKTQLETNPILLSSVLNNKVFPSWKGETKTMFVDCSPMLLHAYVCMFVYSIFLCMYVYTYILSTCMYVCVFVYIFVFTVLGWSGLVLFVSAFLF